MSVRYSDLFAPSICRYEQGCGKVLPFLWIGWYQGTCIPGIMESMEAYILFFPVDHIPVLRGFVEKKDRPDIASMTKW